MSQHTFSISNEAGAAFRSDVNNALQALASQSSGAAAPGTSYAYQRWADTTTSTLKQRNAANSAWLVKESLDETFSISRSSNTILGLSDHAKTLDATASFTQTLTAAATLGDGWAVDYRVESGVKIVFDPNAAETIDGAATKTVIGPCGGRIRCNGSSFVTSGFPYQNGVLSKGFISGLTYGNGDGAGAGDLVNDITLAAGKARDATDAVDLVLAAAITKQLDAAWAVGNAAGGLDTGAIGNSDYYLWLIMRSDTGVVDALFSLSSTAPTMPSNYDFKRLIGWFKRASATIVAFHTYEAEAGGLELRWDALTQDVALTNTLSTSRRTDAVKVPLNFSTTAILSVQCFDAGSNFNANICCPDQTDAAIDPAASSMQGNFTQTNTGVRFCLEMWIRTSATGTIAARANIATVDVYVVVTLGFRWARRV